MGSDAISPAAGQGGNPGPTDHNCGRRVATSYARLEKREMSLEAMTEPRPISPNNGYALAVSGSVAGAGSSCTFPASTRLVASAVVYGSTCRLLLPPTSSTDSFSPCSTP